MSKKQYIGLLALLLFLQLGGLSIMARSTVSRSETDRTLAQSNGEARLPHLVFAASTDGSLDAVRLEEGIREILRQEFEAHLAGTTPSSAPNEQTQKGGAEKLPAHISTEANEKALQRSEKLVESILTSGTLTNDDHRSLWVLMGSLTPAQQSQIINKVYGAWSKGDIQDLTVPKQ